MAGKNSKEAHENIKIVLSGIGLIGQVHAKLITQSKRSDLVGIVAPPSARNLDAIRKLGISRYDKLEHVFNEVNVDGVLLASPNEVHFDQAIECIQRKIPVLVEKPLTSDVRKAKELCFYAQKSDVPVLVGHHRTYSPLYPTARKFVNSNKFGQLVAVQGSALFYKPDSYFEAGHWRKLKGGGPILINLIHEIGFMRYVCGEINSVLAHASQRVRGFEIEDTVSISLSFENGALGTFLLSDTAASNKSWEMTSGENPTYPHYPDANCYHFAGTNGSFDFPNFKARYYNSEDERSWWTQFQTDSSILVTQTDPLTRQLEHFEDVIIDCVDPIVTAEDGLKNMLVIQAILDSIENGQKITVSNA